MKNIITYITEALKLGNDKRNHNLEQQIADVLIKELLRIKNITHNSFAIRQQNGKKYYKLFGKEYLQQDCEMKHLNLEMFKDVLPVEVETNINQFSETRYTAENEKYNISLICITNYKGYIDEIMVSENIYQRLINHNK
jgi:hypothetical protein